MKSMEITRCMQVGQINKEICKVNGETPYISIQALPLAR